MGALKPTRATYSRPPHVLGCACVVLLSQKPPEKNKSLAFCNSRIAFSLDECSLISPLKKLLHPDLAAFVSFDTDEMRVQSALSRLVTWMPLPELRNKAPGSPGLSKKAPSQADLSGRSDGFCGEVGLPVPLQAKSNCETYK